MKASIIVSLFISLLLFSCNSNIQGDEYTESDTSHVLTSQIDSVDSDTLRVVPVWGYRFVISGDFDGDGKQEELIEHFFSGISNQETNKFYENLADYGDLVDSTVKKDPISFLTCDDERIDTLLIHSGGQLFGLSYLKNEGDLNGDGNDEISYVINWADWSNLNTWHVATYKNNEWKELYSFPIWDWQLQDLPETYNQYGPMGLEQKHIFSSNDSITQTMEMEMKNFSGLLRKVKNNRIEVIFRNHEAMIDTMEVDLRKLK